MFPFESEPPSVYTQPPPQQQPSSDSDAEALVRCLCVLRAHASDIRALAFSARGELLAAAGKDPQSRILLAMWDVSNVLDDGKVALVARQLSEFDVTKLAFSPYPEDPFSLVSCGNQSIRFWRLRKVVILIYS